MCGLFKPHCAEALDIVEGAEGWAPGRELGLPAILASGLFEMYELWVLGISVTAYWNLFYGITSAFVFGYLSIDFLLRFLRAHGTMIFVVYRVVLGGMVLFV